jgi:hypothetical protein
MQGHAYSKWPGRTPHFTLERTLGFQRGRQRIRGTGKGRVEAIPSRVEDDTMSGSDRVAQDGIVAGKGIPHGRWVLFPQPGAAFNIGEEKGDRAGRQIGAGLLGRSQPIHAHLSKRGLQERQLVVWGQSERIRQARGDLARGTPLICLDLADGDFGAADAASYIRLGQVEGFAAPPEPQTK